MTVSQCDLKGPCGKVLDYVNQQVIRGFGDSSTQHELHQAPSRRFARHRLPPRKLARRVLDASNTHRFF